VSTRRPESLAAEAAFHDRLRDLGAELLEPEWLGTDSRHHVRCAAGHDCYPRPHDVRPGAGICRACAGCDKATAAAAFRARLAELGAVPLYEEYRGVKQPHHVRCANGHDCHPRPDSVVANRSGVCRICAGFSPVTADAAFRARLEELGAVPLFDGWLGAKQPHHVRCRNGHDCHPSPSDVKQGCGICRTCARTDPAVTEAAFRSRLAELGAELLERYVSNNVPHHVLCAAGHDCYPRPKDAIRGRGICVVCSQRDPVTAEREFRWRLAELGAVLLESRWLGADKPHRVRCAQGHLCRSWPASVRSGSGTCRSCACSRPDVFYVVTGAGVVKFGVTSGDPRPRLRNHAARGYTDVIRLATGLLVTVALDAEDAVKSALAMAGEKPVRGREYFDVSCAPLIIDVADSWLTPPQAKVLAVPQPPADSEAVAALARYLTAPPASAASAPG
jgi:single CXXC unit